MFPEITRDDVFRIETPRLWLRWPVPADADALAALMAQTCAVDGATITQVNAGALLGLIAAWREDMVKGCALHFTLQLKTGARQVVGVIHTGTERSCIAAGHCALGDEAADALWQMTALLGLPQPLRRSPPMAQQRTFTAPALRVSCCAQA